MVEHGANSSVSPRQPRTIAEELSEQFYSWEVRGRGWDLWPSEIDLEPPYRPFFYYLPTQHAIDDARQPGLWESFKSWLLPRSESQQIAEAFEPDEPPPQAPPFEDRPEVTEFQLLLPDTLRIGREECQRFVLSLISCRGPVSFEIVGSPEHTKVQFSCYEADADHVRQQLSAHFPEAVITHPDNSLAFQWFQLREGEGMVIDFALSEEFCRPLRHSRDFNHDPLTGIVAALNELQDKELGVLQVLFQPVRNPWAESVFHAVTNGEGRSFFTNAPDMLPLARQKVSSPLNAVVVRVAVKSSSMERSWQIARSIGSGLAQFEDPTSNKLIPLSNKDYDVTDHQINLLCRTSRRTGMLLNTDELISLVHPPSPSVKSSRFVRLEKHTRTVPAIATGHECALGDNIHNGEVESVSLGIEHRLQHMHVIGASGTGKSTLLLNMIVQDMNQGNGLAVLDPHGDLIDDILARVPDHRLDDVVLVDPADSDYPIGFNILSAHSDLEKNLLASDFVSIFQRLATSWGDQMTTVLANAVLAFLESDDGGTIGDLRRFLVEKDYRKRFLTTVKDAEIAYYWEREFTLLSGKPQGPILTRLDTFLRPKPIRYMVCQKENRLDFGRFMDEGKIFLARLPQGLIGEENSYLLGSLLVSKFQQLALARQEQAAAGRKPFFLYVDEFHNFICPSVAPLLTGARKYKLGLVLAHQELRQLERRDSEVASAVLSNPYCRICFRVGDADAKKLADGFGHFEANDLQNLGRGEAICRAERADFDFNLRTRPVGAIEENVADERRIRIRELSRQKYGRPRTEIEAELAAIYETNKPHASPRSEWTQPEKQEPRTEPANQYGQDAVPSETEPALPTDSVPAKTETSGPEPSPRARIKRDVPDIPPPLGKGGQQHRYLQQLIKRWAEGMGYKATIEKALSAGMTVDVALEKNETTIACEINVTSTTEYETGNIKKCIDAGFGHIVVVGSEKRKLSKIEKAAKAVLTKDSIERVHFLTPEELFQFVEALDAEAAAKEEMVRGYKVNVNYNPVSDKEKQGRKRAVSKVVMDALKRMNRK